MSEPDLNGAPDAPYAEPLPREWLPEAVAPEGDAVWEARAERIVGAAESEWARFDARTTPWIPAIGGWLRPAVALAAGAAALLFAVSDRVARAVPAADALALGVVVANGDPAALWAALGVSADPVLALLTLEDHEAWLVTTSPTDPATGDIR
jgi:hypothetical protein